MKAKHFKSVPSQCLGSSLEHAQYGKSVPCSSFLAPQHGEIRFCSGSYPVPWQFLAFSQQSELRSLFEFIPSSLGVPWPPSTWWIQFLGPSSTGWTQFLGTWSTRWIQFFVSVPSQFLGSSWNLLNMVKSILCSSHFVPLNMVTPVPCFSCLGIPWDLFAYG